MAVVLQQQRQPVGVRRIVGALAVYRPAGDDRVVLDEHAVVQDGHPRRVAHRPVRREVGPVKDDVVGLPLTRRAARVDERRGLPVYRGRLAGGTGGRSGPGSTTGGRGRSIEWTGHCCALTVAGRKAPTSKSAECGIRSAEYDDERRLATDLSLRFRTPHSAFRTWFMASTFL